jgi:predicted dehydrogenase
MNRAKKPLGIGFIGSGFVTRFHIQSLLAVRDAEVRGVFSPTRNHAEEAAALSREKGVGDARTFDSIGAMVSDPSIDAIWICGPNHQRVANMEAVVEALEAKRGELIGISCEKPLGRNVAEAKRMRELVERAGVLDGYLENQVFTPAVTRGKALLWSRGARLAGRPYLARAAEEHSGPHASWFWRGDLQGGGVLNDMMCHSIETARFLLTDPAKKRGSLTPRRVSASIACLKWQRPEYARKLKAAYGSEVDYDKAPSEDFARALVEYADEEENPVIVEATTSWSYVGAGLRLSMEVLGPEYSMSVNTLSTELSLFFSRELRQTTGEDLVEKQNAELGLMPVVADETASYGYVDENRHMVQSFLSGSRPRETFDDGVAVTELLMAAYLSAEHGSTVDLSKASLDAFVPAVARGAWNPRK